MRRSRPATRPRSVSSGPRSCPSATTRATSPPSSTDVPGSAAKLSALRAHRTQIDDDAPFFRIGRYGDPAQLAVEHYRLARGAASPPFDADGRETDLFAGVAAREPAQRAPRGPLARARASRARWRRPRTPRCRRRWPGRGRRLLRVGVLSAIIEVLLIPLYLGSHIFPLTRADRRGRQRGPADHGAGHRRLALGDLRCRSCAGSSSRIALGFTNTSHGSVLVPGYGDGEYVGLALFFVGTLAGFISVMRERRVGQGCVGCVGWPARRR